MQLRFFMAALVAALLAPALRAAEPIDPKRFESIHSTIMPAEQEQTWNEIPWLASLWEARALAAREGKPILLWEMDGHPLGCV